MRKTGSSDLLSIAKNGLRVCALRNVPVSQSPLRVLVRICRWGRSSVEISPGRR